MDRDICSALIPKGFVEFSLTVLGALIFHVKHDEVSHGLTGSL